MPATAARLAPALLGRAVLPACGLLLTPLFNKRLCATPLSEALLRPGAVPAGAAGYLSMDQARSLLPLDGADAAARSTPLVGVWVKGPDSPLHPLAAAACLRFFYASTLLDRALQGPDGDAFLLLLLPEGAPAGRCYEARATEPRALPLTAFTLAADLDAGRQLERHPGGLIPLEWAPEARRPPPPPLALPPAAAELPSVAAVRAALGSPPLDAARLTASGPAATLFPAHRASPDSLAAPPGAAMHHSDGAWPSASPRRHAPSSAGSGAGIGVVNGSCGDGGSLGYTIHTAAAAVPGARAASPRLQPQWQQAGGDRWGLDIASEDGGAAGDGVCVVGSPAGLASGPRSPPIPVLLGGPGAPSPTRHGLRAGAFNGGRPWSGCGGGDDALRDSLESGQRAVTAAAAAIANAEAAVLRTSGGCPGALSPPQLQRFAVAASAPALVAPPPPSPLSVAASTSPTPPARALAASAAAAWHIAPDARELQDEVLRLRAEVRGRQGVLCRGG